MATLPASFHQTRQYKPDMQEALHIDLIAKYLSGNIETPEIGKSFWPGLQKTRLIRRSLMKSPECVGGFRSIRQRIYPPNETKIESAWQAKTKNHRRPQRPRSVTCLWQGTVRAAAVVHSFDHSSLLDMETGQRSRCVCSVTIPAPAKRNSLSRWKHRVDE